MPYPETVSAFRDPAAPLTPFEKRENAREAAINERAKVYDELEAAHVAVVDALEAAVRDGDGIGAAAALSAMRRATALLTGAVQ